MVLSILYLFVLLFCFVGVICTVSVDFTCLRYGCWPSMITFIERDGEGFNLLHKQYRELIEVFVVFQNEFIDFNKMLVMSRNF